ncbi:hypothetical protein JCM11491_005621 [Sporobolomyces phaffii]
MEPPPTHGVLAGFAARKSSYLRISPTLVLQLVLYLEPHHVEWMNVGVFERMLVALKERIPTKLEQEGIVAKGAHKSGGGAAAAAAGKPKDKVDVFRGTDYQMAFFFRKTNDRHVVLLKASFFLSSFFSFEKHLHYVTRSVPRRTQPRSNLARPDDNDDGAPPPPPHPHTKPASLSHGAREDDNDDDDEEERQEEDALGMMGPPPLKRQKRRRIARGSDDSSVPLNPGSPSASSEQQASREEEEPGSAGGGKRRRDEQDDDDDDEVVVIKPEPNDDEPDPLVSSLGRGGDPTPLFRREEEESQTPAPATDPFQDGQREEEEMKEELDDDVKPQLKVNYQKFDIFNRSLVVIVEPYPPLPASQLAKSHSSSLVRSAAVAGGGGGGEVRQLSASVQPADAYYPDSYSSSAGANRFRGRSESTAAYSRAGTLSVTPAPTSSSSTRRGGGGGGGRTALFRRSETTPLGDDDGQDEEDEHLRGLREMSEVFRRSGDHHLGGGAHDDDDDDEEEGEGEGEEELPSVDELMERRSKRMNQN